MQISNLNDDALTSFLVKLGPRKAVFVEGKTDEHIFEQWYEKELDKILFHKCGGSPQVKKWLNKFAERNIPAHGVIDRDFLTDEEISVVEQTAGLYVLSRYAIENYLLEPNAVFEELRTCRGMDPGFCVSDAAAMRDELLRLCRKLKTLMAANWVILESVRDETAWEKFFTEGHKTDQKVLIESSAKKLNLDEAEAKRRITEKEAELDAYLTELETAHKVVNGKHLLFRLYDTHATAALKSKNVLLNLLTRFHKDRDGIHQDIRDIIERRILGRKL
jgi:hypothetical protein